MLPSLVTEAGTVVANSPSKVTLTFVFFSALPIKAIISCADIFCAVMRFSIHIKLGIIIPKILIIVFAFAK